ncbi:winged helix-turn-helix transcriptional regulator [Bacteroides acidifaciens]|uniref:winged helix-turn-helix transcriptional regulator n=1 Tax=Bacteroides acidifaciens TaxID=85831 RepID=UPI003F68BB4C
MTKKEEKKSIIEICPIRNVIARFGNKWALLVIYILNENGAIRFNQLARQIPDISTKVLSDTLHILEADGLVKRTVFPEVPIRVEYELTETGRSLVPIIISLTEWAQNNMKSIMAHRKKFENSANKSN